jgi:hypothetical protein
MAKCTLPAEFADADSPLQPLTVSIKTAQALTGKSRSALYESIGNGQLDAVKDGKRTLITWESIQRRQNALPRAVIKPARRKMARHAVSRKGARTQGAVA